MSKAEGGEISGRSTPSIVTTNGTVAETPPPGAARANPNELFVNITTPKIKKDRCLQLAGLYEIDWEKLEDHGKRVIWFLFDRKVHKAFEEEGVKEPRVVGTRLLEAVDTTTEIWARVSVILYERGQTFEDTVPDGVQTYDEFLNSHEHWISAGGMQDAFLNLIDKECEDHLDVFRQVQLSGNCYLHGPVSTYQYVCDWHKVGSKRVIDIPRFMRHTFDQHDIKSHLFDGSGGRSENFLKKLAGDVVTRVVPLMDAKMPVRDMLTTDLLKYMKTLYGPVLFAGALLSSDFGSKHSYEGSTSEWSEAPPKGKKDTRERHSMVLLGIQKRNDNWWFLLQNWHTKTQFLEVDYDWVLKSKAQFWAVYKEGGTRGSPSIENEYVVDDQGVISYSESSPGVERSASGDRTKSFSFKPGLEKI